MNQGDLFAPPEPPKPPPKKKGEVIKASPEVIKASPEVIQALHDQIEELSEQLRGVIYVLGPFYARRESIGILVAMTHEWKEVSEEDGQTRIVVTKYKREGAEERKGLFDEYDRLHFSHAPERARQSELRKELEAAQRKLWLLCPELKPKKKKDDHQAVS